MPRSGTTSSRWAIDAAWENHKGAIIMIPFETLILPNFLDAEDDVVILWQ